jgi:DNA polymerase-3 subunit beta
MKVEVVQENLAKALGHVGRVASSRAGLEILSNVLIRTEGKQLLIAATNLEIAITERIGAKISSQGSITVPAKLINELVQNLPKEKITLTVDGSTLYLESPSNKSSINGVADDEFPELPVIDEKDATSLAVPVATFKQAASQTVITASNDSTRPVLTGVLWQTNENNLYFVATDGYRLAEREVKKADIELNAIVPTTSMQEVLRILSDDNEVIDILFDETQVRFRVNDSEVTSRLIDGNFPDYRQLIPSSSTTTFTVQKSELTQATKLASLFASGAGGNIRIDVADGAVTINSVASEYGENNSSITATIEGEDGSVSLNSRYLLEALAVMDGDTVSFGFSGKLAACILRTNEQNYLHIIMPIKS